MAHPVTATGILPGVGAFTDGMANLQARGLIDILNDLVVKRRKPILGICLGYGVGYAYSEVEGGWRWAYGWTLPASVLLLVGAQSLPPSARWLALRGKNVEAVASLAFGCAVWSHSVAPAPRRACGLGPSSPSPQNTGIRRRPEGSRCRRDRCPAGRGAARRGTRAPPDRHSCTAPRPS